MKNIRIYLTISLLALFSLLLSACDGVAAGNLGLDLQAARNAHGAEDTNFNSAALASSSAADASTSSSSELRLKGTVEAVTANTLTINGSTFTVDTLQDLTTLFSVGTVFEIEYRQSADGSITLLKFNSEDQSTDYDVEFKGMVEAVTATTLTFNGETFTVAGETDLTTLITAGQWYEIKYISNDDGTISLVLFNLEDNQGVDQNEDDNQDYDVEFKGMLEEVTATTLTLNGETFSVTTDEDLTTLFVAGQFYEIKYIFNQDGTITIVSFHAEDEDDDMDDDSFDDLDDDSSDDSNNDNNSNDDSNNSNNDSNYNNSDNGNDSSNNN